MNINNSIYKKLGKNIGLLTIGSFASKLLNYFLVPVYTSILSTDDYGTADLIMTSIMLILPVITLQVGDAAMRFLLDGINSTEVVGAAITVIKLGLVGSIVLSPIVLLIPGMVNYFTLFVIILMTDIINSFLGQVAKGAEKVIQYSISGVISTFTVGISNILFLCVFKWGIEGYLLSYLLGYCTSILYLIISNRVLLLRAVKIKTNWNLIKKMLGYSIPLIPNAVCWWINNSSDKYMIRVLRDASSTGIYSIAYKVPSLLSTIMAIFFGAWQISSVDRFGSDESKQVFKGVFNRLIFTNTIIALILITFSKFIGKALFEKDFFVAWRYTIPLIIAYYYNTMASFMGSIYTASKKTKMLFVTTVVSSVINIILNLLLIPIWGILGAAIATCVSYLLVFVIRIIDTRKFYIFGINYTLLFVSLMILVFSSIFSYFEVMYNYLFNGILLLLFLILFLIYKKRT